MADMMNFPGAAATPAAQNDISQFMDTAKPAGPTGTPVKQTFSDEDISSYFQQAIDAVGRAASKTIQPYQSPDTEKYLQSLTELRVLHDGNLADIDVQRKMFESASTEEQRAYQAEASAQIARNNADQSRAQTVANISYELNHEMGVDGNANRLADKVGVFHQLNDQSILLKSSVEQDAAALREETSVGFFDNPARWLAGVFTIPQLTDKLEAGTKQIGILDNKIAGVKDDINETLSANAAATEARSKAVPSITAQQAAAANDMAAAVATAKAAKTKEELARQNSTFAGLQFAETLSETSAEHGAVALAQEQKMNEFRAKLQEVVKANSDAEAKLKIVDLMEKMQDRRQIEGMLRLTEVRMGLPKGYLTYTGYLRSPDSLKQFYVGQAAGYTGATPGDAYYNYVDAAKQGAGPGPLISPQTQKMLKDMHQFAEGWSTDTMNATQLNGKNKDEQRNVIKTAINGKLNNNAAHPTSDPQTNPFYEVTPSIVAQHFQGFAQTIEGKLLEPVIKSPNAPTLTSDVVAVLTKGSATPEEAATRISNYYKLNQQVRNSVTDYQALGITPPTVYNWTTSIAGPMFKSQRTLDLTNRTQVLNYLYESQKAAKISEMVREGNKANTGL